MLFALFVVNLFVRGCRARVRKIHKNQQKSPKGSAGKKKFGKHCKEYYIYGNNCIYNLLLIFPIVVVLCYYNTVDVNNVLWSLQTLFCFD